VIKERGIIQVKGKGNMVTYWISSAAESGQDQANISVDHSDVRQPSASEGPQPECHAVRADSTAGPDALTAGVDGPIKSGDA
jgi:hypothetical protein